jgi:protein MpaA
MFNKRQTSHKEDRWMTAHRKMLVFVCSLIASAGCQEPRAALDLPPIEPQVVPAAPPIRPAEPRIARPPVVAPRRPQLVQALPAGRSVQGRPVNATAIGNGDQCVMFIGGIHGNEPAGVGLCEQLAAYLGAHDELVYGLKVIVIPAANPDGLAGATRGNAHGVDINRNFATGNYRSSAINGGQAMSQPEAQYLRELIDRYRPVRIITIHQPLSCIDYDGPAQALAATVARASGLPIKKLGARPGSLGSYAGVENRIPTVTVELPKDTSNLTPVQVWARYGGALMAAVNPRGSATTLDNVGK